MAEGDHYQTHPHTCASCGHTWDCITPRKCEIEKAAKVNKHGPICHLCYHIEFARRFARQRGLWTVESLLEQASVLERVAEMR